MKVLGDVWFMLFLIAANAFPFFLFFLRSFSFPLKKSVACVFILLSSTFLAYAKQDTFDMLLLDRLLFDSDLPLSSD